MFWTVFERLCIEAGKTPANVLSEVGLSHGAQTKWRNGAKPNADALIALSEYFGVSVDYLLTGKVCSKQTVTLELTANESEMLNLFRELSERDQVKWIARTEDFVEKCNNITAPSWTAKG